MTLKVVNTGEVQALRCFLNAVSPENHRLCLYQNNTSITDVSTVSTFVDASFPGYAPVILVGATWVFVPGSPTQAEYPAVTFTCSANLTVQTVYGYYVMSDVTLELMWAEAFPTPQAIMALGQEITVVPRFTASDQTD